MPLGQIQLRGPAILASSLVIPFMILELANRPGSFPIPLFAMMWLVPFAFAVIVQPTIRNFRSRRSGVVNSLVTFLGPVSLIVLAWFWVVLVNDQMPCFLGVPNCD